ncbi:hypothetical protein [Nocardia crassostreae]|uniref:hypothetical protein n=1 Tax=Nocardia crassostreae TaxID=53428 RepID=UPI000AB21CAC|nr:hypothetical protein [Nocardia crassostreae]
MTSSATERVDHATRILASAAHLDDQFADLLIEEFLIEPNRAIPPSPGVRAEVVLCEAVAAQARRRRLNAVLLALLTIMALFALPLTLIWLLSAMIWRFCSVLTLGLASSKFLSKFGLELNDPTVRWWVTAAMWSVSPLVVLPLLGWFLLLIDIPDVSAPAVLALISFGVLVPTMYGVLVAKEYLPWSTVNNRYGFATWDPTAPLPKDLMRTCAPYADRLRRIADDDTQRMRARSDEVIVYRGNRPFLGAGTRVRSWSAAFELRASNSKSDAPPQVPTFLPSDLQKYVADDLEKLREAPNLTPGWRFADLEISRWAMLSAVDLPYAPGGDALMAQLYAGNVPRLAEEAWNHFANQSPEWLRFYRCFRLEGWARQLAVSGYLHVGCEQQMLVVDWHAFVLPPVAGAFRHVDNPPRMLELRAMWAAAAELALLPSTAPSRMIDVVRGVRDRVLPRDGEWRTPEQAAHMFGAAVSVRELAQGNRLNNLFQEADCDRYLKILERRVLDAIQRYLDERKITAKGLSQMATQIFNSTILNNSNVIAGNIGGQSNTGSIESNDGDSGKPIEAEN